jgi:glycine cleavage system aminomethyltransferase T
VLFTAWIAFHLVRGTVKPIGLGARDSLRLEAGLCLYGNDLDETTTPSEAGLLWTIPKSRRETGGFCGSDVILGQIKDKKLVKRKRVGFVMGGRGPPPRSHMEVYNKVRAHAVAYVLLASRFDWWRFRSTCSHAIYATYPAGGRARR